MGPTSSARFGAALGLRDPTDLTDLRQEAEAFVDVIWSLRSESFSNRRTVPVVRISLKPLVAVE